MFYNKSDVLQMVLSFSWGNVDEDLSYIALQEIKRMVNILSHLFYVFSRGAKYKCRGDRNIFTSVLTAL